MPKIKRKPQNSFIGENAKNKKEITSLQDRLDNQLEVIETAKNELAMKGKELNELKSQLSELSRHIDNSRRKLSHKKSKLKRLSEETNTVTNACSLQQSCRNKNVFTVSNLTAAKRRLNPSHDNLPHKAKCVRQNETFSVCSLIHGGGKGNELPSITGILDTLTSKVKSDDLSAKILKAKPAFVKRMSKKCVDSWSKDYYLSNENILRSLNIYYSKNVMGKRKYLCMRRANCRASFKKSKIPNVYYGASETRFNNHTKSFKHQKYRNDTELSKLVWKLKEEATPFEISWEIESKASPYKCGTRRCDLCLAEKVCIIRAEPKGLINKRTELLSRCRHRNKYIIANVK